MGDEVEPAVGASLVPGDCVEVSGLESESGKPLNGQIGVITMYVEEKGRFEVRFSPEKSVNLKPENLRKLEDLEKFVSIQKQFLATVQSTEVADRLARMRAECEGVEHFTSMKDALMGEILGPLTGGHGVDIGWYLYCCGAFAGDEEVAARNAHIEQVSGYVTEGPGGIKTGDCVEAVGLEPESGKEHLNGQRGIVKTYQAAKEKFEVSFVPEHANLRAENLRKLDDRERFDSFQEQLLASLEDPGNQGKIEQLRRECYNREHFDGEVWKVVPAMVSRVCERHGVSLEWYVHFSGIYGAEDPQVAARNQRFVAATTLQKLGPSELDKGVCVQVFGLESESGKAMNGQHGLVTSYDDEKGRYEVRFNEEKVVNLKPANIRPISDREKFEAILSLLIELMSTPAMKAQMETFREKCMNVLNFGKSFDQVRVKFQEPICNRHGVSMGWFWQTAAALGEDEGLAAKVKDFQDMCSYGTIGSGNLEKGAYFEIFGLESEAGRKMNGLAVMVKGWNEEKGRYDVAPPEDLQAVKAIKPENLTPIPERYFENEVEAYMFAVALKEAYSQPEAIVALERLKQKFPNMSLYVSHLRGVIMPFQKPVLEKFGFRGDHVGQNHMQKALGAYEHLEYILDVNRETERMLGLPQR